MPERSTQDVRRSIEATRAELSTSVNQLQVKVGELTDWRAHLTRNRTAVVVGAAAAGFLIGGGVAGVLGLIGRRR